MTSQLSLKLRTGFIYLHAVDNKRFEPAKGKAMVRYNLHIKHMI